MVVEQRPDERRLARHQETREQIVAHAIDIMGTQGVAGLSLGELARRLGVRTPSLYTYFDSKNALYDELYRRGWQECHDEVRAHAERLGAPTPATDVIRRGQALQVTFIRWALDHPALSQLMLLRPVPAWEPSPSAYQAAVDFFDLLVDEVHSYRDQGLLRPDADLDEMATNIATIGTGVIASQLANEPGVPYDRGRAAGHFPALATAVIQHYLPQESHHEPHPDPRR
jgi:AcrR family transcriptional regulator